MSSAPKILVVDDEEAILETMTFTFQDDYEVFTSTDARKGLEILDEQSPVAVVLTDQRMPEMSGVEFVSEVCRRHPATATSIPPVRKTSASIGSSTPSRITRIATR